MIHRNDKVIFNFCNGIDVAEMTVRAGSELAKNVFESSLSGESSK